MIHPVYLSAVVVSFVGVATVADVFSGDYTSKNEDVTCTLTLAQDGDAITGTFSDGSEKMGLRGTVAAGGKQASGKLSLNGQELPITFTLRRDGDKLRFAMIVAGEEDTFLFTPNGGTKSKPAMPEEKPAPVKNTATVKPTAPAKTAAVSVKGGAYRHPSGFRLPLAEGWRVLPAAGWLVLLPPGAARPTPEEGYMLFLTDAGGDKVAQKLEETFAQTPGLRRTGESTSTGWLYEGEANGAPVRVRCYITPGNNAVAAVLLANGTAAKMKKSEPALGSMMRGAKWAQPAADERLVGTWRGGLVATDKDVRGVGGKLTVTGATDTNTSYRLDPNGVFTEMTTSRSIFIGQGVSIDTGDTVEKKASRWSAEGGVLTITKNGFYMTGTYRFEGDRLIVTFGDKTLALQRN